MRKGEWGRARDEGDGLSSCHEILYKPWNGFGTLLKVRRKVIGTWELLGIFIENKTNIVYYYVENRL